MHAKHLSFDSVVHTHLYRKIVVIAYRVSSFNAIIQKYIHRICTFCINYKNQNLIKTTKKKDICLMLTIDFETSVQHNDVVT